MAAEWVRELSGEALGMRRLTTYFINSASLSFTASPQIS